MFAQEYTVNLVEFGLFDSSVFWTYESKNIVILVNGVRCASPQMNNYVMSDERVLVEAIARIEVVRGPMSVMYGSGAFFGVINIVTNDIYKLPPFVRTRFQNTTKIIATQFFVCRADPHHFSGLSNLKEVPVISSMERITLSAKIKVCVPI